MAGSIIISVRWTVDKLSSLILESSSSSSSSSSRGPSFPAEQEMHKLERTLRRIHAMLDDAEERDISDKSEQLRLRELKEVAYDAEDVVDKYEYKVMHAKVESRRQARDSRISSEHDEVLDWNFYKPKVSISNELACRILKIREKFEEITYDWSCINLREKDGKRFCVRNWSPVETTSYVDESRIFGRKGEKEEIIQWLLQSGETDEITVSVFPIVGMGGIGKTALAQMVYNDTSVQTF